MSYKTRKLWFRICAFLVALVMVSGDLAVSAAAVENENGTQIEVSSEDVDNSVEADASETEGASDETSDEILGEENPNVETDVISEADNYDEKDSEGDSEEDAEAEEDISGKTSEEENVSDSGEAELQSVIKVKDDSTTDAHGFRDVRIDFNKETACIIYGQYLTTDSNEVGGQLSFRIDEYTENTQGAECKYSTSLKGNGTLPVLVDQYQSVNGLGYVLNPSLDGNVRNIPLAKDTKYVKIVAYKIADESVVGETDFIKRDDFPAPSSKLETVGLTDNSATIEFAIQSLYTNSLQGDFTIRYGMKGDENNWNEYSDTPEELYYQNSKEKVYTWEFANLTEGTEYGYTVEADISINVNSVDKPIYSVENSGSFKTKNNSSFVFNEAFPDEAFRKVVVEKVKSLTGKADPSETEIKENLYRITDIYYNENLTYGKIQSLKGIEYLTGLRYINVDNNDISEFPDMRNNVGLRNGVLSILYNKLSDEEVSSIRDKLTAHCGFLSENWIAETRATQNKVKPGGGDVELEYAPVYYNDGNSAKFFVLFNREFGRVEAFVDDICFTMQNSVNVGGMSLSFEEKSKGKRLYVGDLSGNISGTKTVTIKAYEYEYDYESEPEFTEDISVKFDSNLAFVDGSTIQRADAGKNEHFYVGTGYRYYSSSKITVAVPKTIVMAPDDPENPLTPEDPAYGNVWVNPTVTYTPANANAGIGYYMESSAPDVVEVCGNGTLHALKCGKATITVITNNGVKATIQVIVMNLNVDRSGISINTKDNPDYERTKQLVLSDGTTNYKPEWTSSNPSVAVVDANGLLTILADNTEDGYAEISATYNGTVFSRWINVVRPVESITATAHKEYLEVWPDGEENLGYFNDTDYISVTSEPAGLINIGDNEYCNTEFNIITECGERYLEIDAYGNVWAKYDPDLGEGKEITVEVTTTTKKWNSDPPTETNRASSEVTYKIVPADYKRVDHSDGDNVRVRLLSGISGKLGDIELPEALKDDWEWMYPDTDISKYSGMDGAQFAVKHVNKYTHEIHQDFVDVEFVDGPDFWVSWGMEGNLPYFKDERSQGDNAVAPIVYEYWTDGRFEEMYPGYSVDVQAEPNDVLEKDGELYSSWSDLDKARMEGLKINGFRAKRAGNGEVKVTFTVKDAESRVVYTTSKTLKIKTVDATKKGVAWYDGWIIRMRDPEKAVDDYDNWDWGEDKVDPSDESSEALRYIRWDENGNVILEEGQKYLFVTASDSYAVKMKSLDTNVVSLGKAVTHKKGWDEGQRDVSIMPIVMGNPGVTTLSVTVSDAINSTMNINVRIKNDKVTLGATKFTLNRAYKDEHQYEEVTVKRGFDDAMCGAYIDDESNGVNFVPGEDGVDIVKISYPEQFDANGKKIKLAAKHKLYLVYGNPEEPDTLRKAEFDITLSESNKAPKATIKQIQNLNTSFKQVEGYDMYDTAGVFSVGIDGEIIDDVGLTFTDKTGDVELAEGNEYIFRGEDGLVYLYADPGKKKIKVTLKSEKYKDVVSTVSAKTEKKTYALSSSTGTVFTDTGIDGSYNPFDVRLVLRVNDSKTKMPVELSDLDGEVEELKVSVEASVTKGNTGNKYIPHVSDDGKHIILEADFENDVPAKTGDVLTIKVKRPEWTAAAEFKYTIKGESISKTSLVLGAKTITVYNYVGVENCSEKTTLSLKGGAAHDMLGEIKIYENIKKGQEYSIGKKFNAYIDPYLGTINVQKVSDDFEGTYNLKLELSGPWKKPISTTLTVKAVKVNPASADSKTGIKCTTSSKGSIDVLNRVTTGVVITPKFTNIPKDARIEVIGCTGPDAHLFYYYGRNNGTVGLGLLSGVRVLTNFEYKVNIKYSISMDNGTYVEVTSPEVKIKFTQSSAKGVLVGNPTFGNAPVEYHSYVLCVANSSGNNMKIRRVDMDETAGFKLYYSDGNPDSPQGTDLENGIVVIRHDFDGTTTTGKTYTLKLLVYPDDAASNSKPVTVTYKVTLAK